MSRGVGESVEESLTCKSSTRIVDNQVPRPGARGPGIPFEETRVEIDNIYAKRQRTQGWFAEE